MKSPDLHHLFEQNLSVFATYQPKLWRTLARLRPRHSRLVCTDGRATNIDVGGALMYPESARVSTEKQVRTFLESSSRVVFENDQHCCVSPVSEAVRDDLITFLSARKVTPEPAPQTRPAFAFVFGLGLGHHIPELVARDIAADIVVFEPMIEFMAHSLSAVDWANVFETAERQGNRIQLIPCADLTSVNVTLQSMFGRDASALFLEGSLFYDHYDSEDLKRIKKIFADFVSPHFTSMGFFEDELTMMRNTHANFRDRAFRLVSKMPRRSSSVPVFIVGSGPSLDRDLDCIRRHRDRAIIVSASSSLSVLLKNGIRPHVHFESENKESKFPLLTKLKSKTDLDGIRFAFAASATPAATAMFADPWFVFREALSASLLFGTPSTIIDATSPLATNVAFASMAALGFKRIFLFGVDCGAREIGEHHAADSYYFDDDFKNMVAFEKQLPLPVEGNFGGLFFSNFQYDMSRRNFTRAIREFHVSAVNCSDGAAIEGTTPMRSEALTLDCPTGGQEKALSVVENCMEAFKPGTYLANRTVRPTVEECSGFQQAFTAFVAEHRAGCEDFKDLADQIIIFMRRNFQLFQGVIMVMNSSMIAMIRMGDFYRSRISDPAVRAAFHDHFIDQYVIACISMAERCKTLFEDDA